MQLPVKVEILLLNPQVIEVKHAPLFPQHIFVVVTLNLEHVKNNTGTQYFTTNFI